MINLIKKLGRWMKRLFWTMPTAEPPKEEPIKVKATEVAKEYMTVVYHGQRINLHVSEYPIWKTSSREKKREIKARFEKQEKEGLIRWEEVEGKMICIRNLNYDRRAEKAKEGK